MELYENLKYLAGRKGMSIPEFADKMGVGKTTIYKWRTSSPSVDILLEVADFFDVSVEFLVGKQDKPYWATTGILYDLEMMLNSNVNMAYGGEELTEEEKRRVKAILTEVFWEKVQHGKDKETADKELLDTELYDKESKGKQIDHDNRHSKLNNRLNLF